MFSLSLVAKEKMKFTLLSIFALSSLVIGQRNPNPCENVTGSSQFRNDWSSCRDYFWCNNGEAVPVPTPCSIGFGFDEERQLCTPEQAECEACPPEGTIAVGDPEDPECRRFYICSDSELIPVPNSCGVGTRFNRVTGLCDHTINVPCNYHGAVVDGCSPGATEDVNSLESCDSFYQCVNGENTGIISCGSLHFNPSTGTCDLPSNLDPPCED